LIMAIVTVPGDLANGLLAGVSPVHGLYSLIGGTAVAALFTGSVIMNVDSTSASALATAEVVKGFSADRHFTVLVTLGLLVGAFQLLFGLLKLGSLINFISNAVMTGFLTGIATLTILGQVGDLTRYASDAPNKVFRAIDTLLHPGQIDLPTLAIGLLTMLLVFVVGRMKALGRFSYAVALAVASLVVPLLGLQSVTLVGDTTEIPRQLFNVHLPDLSLLPTLFGPALAIAVITLVQAAGVGQAIPNPDGRYPDPNQDFRGQGMANFASGVLGGIPVGGSLSGTTLIRSCGGAGRWSNIFTALFGALAVLLLASVLERLPLPALAGLLVMVGIEMFNPRRIATTLRTSGVSAFVMLLTFVATLFLPIQSAVAIGVVLHFFVHIYQSAKRVRIEQYVLNPDGSIDEIEAPPLRLASNDVTLLHPVGSLFFAGAAEFESKLPEIGQAERPVVIIELRDRDELGSTFIRVLERYAHALQRNGGALMLSGVNDRVLEQLRDTDLLQIIGSDHVFMQRARVGGALLEANAKARAWLSHAQSPSREKPS
ncbi:MAG: SulP family inorganic anion transporter, partial [Anaerolineae bacterium]|nr:SulP family inorganic anion transporter [Candidatus Roseilinea sp.]MDW8451277.1 SulP family inorganic anion transporter [Anaerolineae bacterium]